MLMERVSTLLSDAGAAGVALVGVSVVLWTSASVRALRLAGAPVARFEAMARGGPRGRVEACRRRALDELAEGRDVLRALVAAAPLLGLLGTVSGMVELFDALHGSAAAVGRGSVAGGISTALVTTQLGLVIGVPGLFAARALEGRERRLRTRIDERARRLSGEGSEG